MKGYENLSQKELDLIFDKERFVVDTMKCAECGQDKPLEDFKSKGICKKCWYREEE